MSLVIVGSVAFDTIETPEDRRERIVGGSCTYSALAASFFTRPKIVGIVGEDFPKETAALMKRRGIDLKGLKIVPGGKTFYWEGRYGDDPNQRDTMRLDLNVFGDFQPNLPPSYRKPDILFLANIGPSLQEHVLSQVARPRLVAMDTIRHYIETEPESLDRVLRKTDIYFANDEEARLMTGERNLIRAGRLLLERGPRLVVLKKGEHGVLVFKKDSLFAFVAHPCDGVVDPTGAGDSFAGAFLGYLDRAGDFRASSIRRAAVYGSVLASFTIEDFGIERLAALKKSDIEGRFAYLKKIASI
ncbi:MAG: sugar kinase [Candidatus Aminicenantes bacterium]|nr:sugar kinase [Candidatus Aminicenantes bacterium]